jgi:hypothetical protein
MKDSQIQPCICCLPHCQMVDFSTDNSNTSWQGGGQHFESPSLKVPCFLGDGNFTYHATTSLDIGNVLDPQKSFSILNSLSGHCASLSRVFETAIRHVPILISLHRVGIGYFRTAKEFMRQQKMCAFFLISCLTSPWLV